MTSRFSALLSAVLLVTLPLAARANDPSAPSLPLTSQVVLSSLNAAAGKMVQLAQAIPEADYGWRPMEGVTSVAEVLTHVAGANYFLASRLGLAVPAGVNPRALGQGANKAELIALFEASVAHANEAVRQLKPEALAEEVDFFGQRAPRAQIVLALSDHGHEHLGQLIAYARANQVVPPWSQ